MDIDEQSPATGISQQMNAAHPPQDDEENNDNDGPWTTVTNVKKPRIPPVIAENVADWKLLCQELKGLCTEPFQVTISGKKHIIKSKNIGDFKKIREYVQKNNGGYSYRLQEEKPLKVVLKGVTTAFKEEDVVTELVSMGFTEVIVKRLHRQSTKIPMNIVLVELPKNEQNKRIYGITEILYQKIVVESFRTTKRVTQCFNCQGFGHGQLNCFLKPKCVKCAEEHHSKDCPRKSKQLPPKCANCGEAHTANYRGCPNFPKPQQQQLKPPRQNSPNTIPQASSTETEEATVEKQKASYAETAKKKTTRSDTRELCEKNYQTIRDDRIVGRGGGTAIILKNYLKYKKVLIQTSNMENTTILMKPDGRTVVQISSIYKKPDLPLQEEDLNLLLENNQSVIAAGDWNSKHPLWGSRTSNNSGTVLHNFSEKENLDIVAPSSPTHYSPLGNPDFLDIAILRNIPWTSRIKTLDALSSDHLPVILELTCPKDEFTTRACRLTNWVHFQQDLISSTPPRIPLKTEANIDSAVTLLNDKIYNSYSKNTVISSSSSKQNPSTKALIKEKNKARKRWQATWDPAHRAIYLNLQGKVNKALKSDSTENWNQFIHKIESSPKDFWRKTKPIRKKTERISSLVTNGKTLLTDKEIGNELAEHFSNQFSKEKEEDQPNITYNHQQEKMLTMTTPNEVKEVIKYLANHKAPGHDNITPQMAKNLPIKWIVFLAGVFNAALHLCYYPKVWKHAIIIPIPKKSAKSPEDLRPISLLPTIGKIYERIILRRLQMYLDNSNFIIPQQFGFRRGHSTTHCSSGLHPDKKIPQGSAKYGNSSLRQEPSKEKKVLVEKRKTATSEDRYLVVTAKRHREMTAIQLSNELSSATGTRISRQTVYRRLYEGALYARRPIICIPLTSAHRRARLNWCLEHHAWTHDQWANVLFSDESRFSLNTDSRRVFIWREPGTRYHPSNIREIDSFRGGSLLVWAGISSSRRTPLHIFSGGTLTAQRYRDEILEPYLRPYRDQIGHNLIFMDDNARPHRARLVNEYLQSENIRRMDWPARSPDLNPIEHVWDALGRRIGARHPSPRTLVELRTALLEEWGLLPLDLLQSLVNSMRARCVTLIAVRAISLYFNGKRIVIANIYIQPNSMAAFHIQFISEILEAFGQLPIILCGDFNSRHPLWFDSTTNKNGYILKSIIEEQNLFVHNLKIPTCRNASIIDLTISNKHSIGLIHNWRTSALSVTSDHLAILFDIFNMINLANNNRQTSTWKFREKSANWTKFAESISPSDLLDLNSASKHIVNCEDIDNVVNKLTNLVIEAAYSSLDVKHHTSINTTTSKNWWNKELDQLKEHLHYLRNLYYRGGNLNPSIYRAARNKYLRAINRAKKTSWKIFIEENESTNAFGNAYRIFKRLRSADIQVGIPLLNKTAECMREQKMKEMLTAFFPDDDVRLDNEEHTLIRNHIPSFTNREIIFITEKEIKDLCSNLNIRKAPGPDNVSNYMIKHSLLSILPSLFKLFNECLVLGYYPESWKHSVLKIITKPQKADYEAINSYRPISLTSNFSKIFETIIKNKILNYYNHNNLLSHRQHGFTKRKSTITALDKITETILKHKQNELVALIAIDISGAFDNAWWPALIKRMDEDHVPAVLIKIIQSFLNRRRKTSLTFSNTTISKYLSKGCPQGGPLSPLLWNIVLNDLLINFASPNSEIICYADDVSIVCWHKTIEGLKNETERTLNYVIQWCTRNKLKLSPEKTGLIHMHGKQNIPMGTPNFIIKPVEEVKILGIKFSNHRIKSKINFTPHINDILCKINRMKNLLFSLCGKMWGLDAKKRLILYKTLFRPILTYGSEIWYKFINKRKLRDPLIDKSGIYAKFDRLEALYLELVVLNERCQAILLAKAEAPDDEIDREFEDCEPYITERYYLKARIRVMREQDRDAQAKTSQVPPGASSASPNSDADNQKVIKLQNTSASLSKSPEESMKNETEGQKAEDELKGDGVKDSEDEPKGDGVRDFEDEPKGDGVNDSEARPTGDTESKIKNKGDLQKLKGNPGDWLSRWGQFGKNDANEKYEEANLKDREDYEAKPKDEGIKDSEDQPKGDGVENSDKVNSKDGDEVKESEGQKAGDEGNGKKDSEAETKGNGVKDSGTAIKGYEPVNNSRAAAEGADQVKISDDETESIDDNEERVGKVQASRKLVEARPTGDTKSKIKDNYKETESQDLKTINKSDYAENKDDKYNKGRDHDGNEAKNIDVEQGTDSKVEEKLDVEQGTESRVEESLDVEQGTDSRVKENLDAEQGTDSRVEENLDVEQGTDSKVEEKLDVEQGTESRVEENLDVEQGTDSRVEENLDAEQGTESRMEEGIIDPKDWFKSESRATPIRPVFGDASCRGHGALALGRYLKRRPILLRRIPEIGIKLRKNKYGVLADMGRYFQAKGYLQGERIPARRKHIYKAKAYLQGESISTRRKDIYKAKAYLHGERIPISYNTAILNLKKREYTDKIQVILSNVKDPFQIWKTINSLKYRNNLLGVISIADWQVFYRELLCSNLTKVVQLPLEILDIDPELDCEISLTEVTTEISKLGKNKATGLDEIPNEAIKYLLEEHTIYLRNLFNKILRTSQVPQQWTKTIIHPIFKNGDQDNPSNYRGISLISNLSKLFTSILKTRLNDWMERKSILAENQAGFRKGYSCQDHIFTLVSLIQMTLSRRRGKLYAFFIDQRKAFDTVPHHLLWKKLALNGLSCRFIKLIKNYYTQMTATVRWRGSFTEAIKIQAGVLQGEPLSPFLFILFLNDLVPLFDESELPGIYLENYGTIHLLLYADDIVILGESKINLQLKINLLKKYLEENCLTLNQNKSKIMVFRNGGRTARSETWFWGQQPLTIVA
ncbi:hypothetical protein LAZ67_1001817, partial [Cordylochernes scorpioides]